MNIYPSHANYQPKSREHLVNLQNFKTEHHMDLSAPDRFDTEDHFDEFETGTAEHAEWLKQKHHQDRILANDTNKVIEQIQSAAEQVRKLDQSLDDKDGREGVILFENQMIGGKMSSGSMRPGVGAYLDAEGGWTESSYFPEQNKPYFHIAADDGSQVMELFEGPISQSTSDKQPDSHYSSDDALSTFILETPEKRVRAEVGHHRMTYDDKPRNWAPHYADELDYPTTEDRLRGRIRTTDVVEYQPTLLQKIRSYVGI